MRPRIVATDLDRDGGLPAVVVRGRPIGFSTDRLLAPRSVARATVGIVSGPSTVFGRVRYDPARRRVAFEYDAESLVPGAEYHLVVRPGLAAWDGATTGETTVRSFLASTDAVPPGIDVNRVSLSRQIAPLLRERCATGGCHSAVRPVMNLDLSSPAAVRNTTVGVVSHEREPWRPESSSATDPQWGSMLRIDAGREPGHGEPAYSYLLYKVLGDGPILGDRMPPPGFEPLAAEDMNALADWIAQGASDN